MMSRTPRRSPNRQILEEAAEWFIEIDGDDTSLATREAFDAWLRKSPEHMRAFLELLPIWEGASSFDVARDAAGEERLIGRFLDEKAKANVVWLSEESGQGTAPRDPVSPPPRQSKWRTPRRVALAASILLAIGGGMSWFQMQRNVFASDIGEQRSLVLPDGSSLELNARSKVRIRFTTHARDVDLLGGQALFRVAKDAAKPFIVHVDNTQVRAVGTQFDVYRKQTATTVTVIEGRVAVTPGTSSAQPVPGTPITSVVELAPGEQVIVAGSSLSPPTHVDIAAATGWTQHRLTFRKAALAEVAEEFNRYNRRQLHIEGASLRAFLVSGSFSSTDPASLLRFLQTQPGIHVIDGPDVIRVVAD